MKLNIYKDVIYQIEEFLTLEEQEYLLELIKEYENTWGSDVHNGFWKNKVRLIENPFFSEHLNKKIKSIFKNYTEIDPIWTLKRFDTYEYIGVHVDEYGGEDIQYGVVVYINDDYEGGEIFYPDLNMEFKPLARSLVAHPGNVMHGTKEVTSETPRYFLTTFVHGKKNQVFIEH